MSLAACAEIVMRSILDAYFAPSRTIADIREIVKSGGSEINPLKDFAEAARDELRAFTVR